MQVDLKNYTLSDLKLGMTVLKEQLSEIYDTWIILIKQKEDEQFKIGFIGKETNVESAKLYNKGYIICPVYNESILDNINIYYEE